MVGAIPVEEERVTLPVVEVWQWQVPVCWLRYWRHVVGGICCDLSNVGHRQRCGLVGGLARQVVVWAVQCFVLAQRLGHLEGKEYVGRLHHMRR